MRGLHASRLRNRTSCCREVRVCFIFQSACPGRPILVHLQALHLWHVLCLMLHRTRRTGATMRFQMVLLGVVGVLGCAVESQAGPIDLFELQAAPDAASRHSSFLDDHSRVASAGMSELTLPERMPPFLVVPTNWWLGNARPAIGSLSRGPGAQAKWRKDQCEDGPCPTTVPEPTTVMLLAIGAGLAAVSTRLRHRQ